MSSAILNFRQTIVPGVGLNRVNILLSLEKDGLALSNHFTLTPCVSECSYPDAFALIDIKITKASFSWFPVKFGRDGRAGF